jgi:hypothetical protein
MMGFATKEERSAEVPSLREDAMTDQGGLKMGGLEGKIRRGGSAFEDDEKRE